MVLENSLHGNTQQVPESKTTLVGFHLAFLNTKDKGRDMLKGESNQRGFFSVSKRWYLRISLHGNTQQVPESKTDPHWLSFGIP